MKVIALSDTGAVRSVNQDSFMIVKNEEKNFLAFAVADGLGGHNAGEVASKICTEILKEYFKIVNKEYDEMLEEIKSIINFINQKIIDSANESDERFGMGTTLTLVCVRGNTADIFHIGDSRCYKINPESIRQVTVDHSLVSHMVAQGEITMDEAQNHPNRNIITNAVGVGYDFFVDSYHEVLTIEDILLICSDGLTEHVSNEEIKEIVLNREKGLEDRGNELIDLANNKGGSDNITIALYSMGEE